MIGKAALVQRCFLYFHILKPKDIHHRIASQRASLIRIFRSIDGINTVIHGDISLRIDRYDIIGSNSFSRYWEEFNRAFEESNMHESYKRCTERRKVSQRRILSRNRNDRGLFRISILELSLRTKFENRYTGGYLRN